MLKWQSNSLLFLAGLLLVLSWKILTEFLQAQQLLIKVQFSYLFIYINKYQHVRTNIYKV